MDTTIPGTADARAVDGAVAATVTIEDLVVWLHRFRSVIDQHQTELTELDSVIGDADHGSNMTRGMTAVAAKLEGEQWSVISDLFKAVGMTLVTSVGGASGPLYGTFFLRFGMSAGEVRSMDAPTAGEALRAGLDGIVARGKAQPGEKTMVDAMAPAIDAWDASVRAGASASAAADAAAEAAQRGRDATMPLVARKGRASYLGERSAGHVDPGAASTALMFRSLSAALGS